MANVEISALGVASHPIYLYGKILAPVKGNEVLSVNCIGRGGVILCHRKGNNLEDNEMAHLNMAPHT